MKILALVNPDSGVSYHRITMPIYCMMKDKPGDYVYMTNHVTRQLMEQHAFDIVLLNRHVDIPAPTMAYMRTEFGFKLVVDNDDYWKLDAHHVLYDLYNKQGVSQKIQDYIRIADICTCTHERLADEIRKINPNVAILPNALPYGHGQFSDAKIEHDKVRLFWAGSDTHAKDISLLRGPMQRIYSDIDLRNRTKVVMSGYSERSKPVWDVMVSAFTHGLKMDNTIYQFRKPDQYMFAACDSDIHYIPLLDSSFNGMKSNLKVLEAAAKKSPAVVSYCNPYMNLPVCYAPTQRRWYQWTRELVFDKQVREAKGIELYEFCNKNFNLYEWNKVRYELYKSLL
jgi:hypothetical protein